jgi:hypothetical protein
VVDCYQGTHRGLSSVDYFYWLYEHLHNFPLKVLLVAFVLKATPKLRSLENLLSVTGEIPQEHTNVPTIIYSLTDVTSHYPLIEFICLRRQLSIVQRSPRVTETKAVHCQQFHSCQPLDRNVSGD